MSGSATDPVCCVLRVLRAGARASPLLDKKNCLRTNISDYPSFEASSSS